MQHDDLRAVAERAVQTACQHGAREAAASTYQVRDVSVQWRDGHLDKIVEATTRGLNLELYVEGRYASVATSDLRPEPLDRFIATAVAVTQAIAEDPYRALPDPTLYQGQAAVDLQLEDTTYDTLSAVDRRQLVQELEAAVRATPGTDPILSVTTSFSDNLAESWRVHSNGFSGHKRGTAFWLGADVSVQDADGRRPEDGAYAGGRFRSELPDPRALGRQAAERTLARLGARKPETAVLPMVVDHRVAGRLVSYLMAPLGAASLQQKRSFLDGRQDTAIGSPLLDVRDDPLLVRGFGSRLFDHEGLAAKAFPVFEQGVLRNFYVDTYYGRKLGLGPTTGRMSNLAWTLGRKTQAELLAEMGEGVLVTGFLGGNSNATTGDFSLGIYGFRVRGGQLAEPLAEMNVSGNHLELWNHLVAVGDDPYPYSAMRTPTLVFEGVQLAGA